MSPLLSLRSITKTYGSLKALDQLSFEIPAGTVVGLLGPNGAGKSTLLKILTGLIQPNSGQLSILNQKNPNSVIVRQQLGYMPQYSALYPNLTVGENLQFFGKLYGLKKEVLHHRIEVLLDVLELTHKKNELIKNLSGGMVRRALLGTSVIHKPKFLILDEPTAGVDPVLRIKFWNWILSWCKEGTSTLITTHHISEANRCDHVIFLRNGKKVEEGPPSDLLRKYNCDDLETAFILATENTTSIANGPFP